VVVREVVPVVFEVEFDALWESRPSRILSNVVSYQLLRIASTGLRTVRSNKHRWVFRGWS
jgi:hypothetical protein